MQEQTAVLQTTNLTIGYDQKVIAAGLDVRLQRGELICLLGPNGAGKSTLLRTLAGMQPALAGQVLLDGVDGRTLTPREVARRLSVVLTERIDVGMLTAYALTALGRHPYTGWSGKLTAQDEAVVQQALTAVGAANLSHRYVNELSDGERQKVMIARALAQQPAIIILDEPTAFLDLPRRVEIMHILRQLAHDEQRAVLLSTHDLDLALRTADTIWLMAQNGALQVGAPEDLVLNGALAAAFASEGVQFQPATGSFVMPQPTVAAIDVIGSGIPALWTTRALERAGYRVHDGVNGAAMRVTTVAENGRLHWRTQINEELHTHSSIESVLATLKQTSRSL